MDLQRAVVCHVNDEDAVVYEQSSNNELITVLNTPDVSKPKQ